MKSLQARWSQLAFALWLTLPVIAQAQDRPEPALSRAELDARLNRQLYQATVAGVNVFNAPNNDPSGCARLFQGALITAEGLLDHRPETKALVERGLRQADTLTNPVEKARALRRVIDDVRAAIEKDQKEFLSKLWNRLGAEKGVRTVVREFVELAANDPKVTRGGQFKLDVKGTAQLEQSLVELVSSVAGGPFEYKSKDLKAAHAGMGLTEDQFNALAADFAAVLKKYKYSQADIDSLAAAFADTKKDIVTADATGPEVVKAVPRPISLWQELGGQEAVKAVVHDFLALAAKNPKVDFSRGGQFKLDDEAVARLEQSLVDFISTVTDGPVAYKGKDMKAAHAGMMITNAEFDAMAADLLDTLKKHKVPQETAEDLLKVVETTRKDIVEKE